MSRNKIPYAVEPGIIRGFTGKLIGVNGEYFHVAGIFLSVYQIEIPSIIKRVVKAQRLI